MKAERTKTKLVLSLFVLGCTLTFLAFCMAEDTDPGMPSGPVKRSDAQPILELPFTISESGSYCLTQNLTHLDRYTNAIEVTADNVTIDLNGYSIIGPTTAYNETCSGIHMNGRKNVEIRNGTITNFPYVGIYDEDSGETMEANGHRIIDVRVTSIGAEGIILWGLNHTIRGCTITQTQVDIEQGFGAITCGHLCMVVGNLVSGNGIIGIRTISGCLIRDNTLADNSFGIIPGNGCSVIDNAVSYNYADGIWIRENDGCLVRGNTLKDNVRNGIQVEGYDNVIEGNLISSSEVGIYFVYDLNVYANNRALYNGINFGGAVPTGVYDGGGNISAGTMVGGSVGAAELQMKVESRRLGKIEKK
ncbi:nitrous oxide reductase family maturation protein NosD [Planctomycetota bacterium]